jgi:hypothetical protein
VVNSTTLFALSFIYATSALLAVVRPVWSVSAPENPIVKKLIFISY